MRVLTKDDLIKEIEGQKITLAPLLDIERQIGEGSIDVRLGTDFILMKRTKYPILDPPEISLDKINNFQEKLHLPFGDTFILHPGQLVLASTFEFVKLPENLCAYVNSRSCYGRLGLLIATAIFVHPSWAGRLTFEMFNYGETPIVLYCGSLIAQLIIQQVTKELKEEESEKQKLFPLGPEFSIMKNDPEWAKLRKFIPE